MIRAGLLRDNITFLKPVVTKGKYGQDNVEYNAVFSTKARVLFKSENRLDSLDEIHYMSSYEFTVRNHHEISHNMLIKYKNNRYRIISIDFTDLFETKIITEIVNE